MIQSAYSNQPTVDLALEEISIQFRKLQPVFILFFSSSWYSEQDISMAFVKTFPGVKIVGCSTAGEIVSGKMLKNSVVAMAFEHSAIDDCCIEVIENISSVQSIDKTIDRIEKYFQLSLREMDYRKYVGLVLMDGLSKAEEKIMDMIGNKSNIVFIGGSAGDDLRFQKTLIYANGRTYTNAALLVLLKPNIPFGFIKTQSFRVLQSKLVATQVNEHGREVIEFNHQPAVKAYCSALGVDKKEIQKYFRKYPVGLMIDQEPYVRSPQQINENNMVFYCQIKEGMELQLLESTDILKDTKNSIIKKIEQMKLVSAIINFNCVLRTLELEANEQTEAYGKIFEKVPTIGFSTYGEAFIGHINQTSTMLVFG